MKKLLITTLATAITLSSTSITFAESNIDTNDSIQITPVEQPITITSRAVVQEEGGSAYSYLGTAYGKIQNKSGLEFATQMASVASITLGVYFAPAAFAGVAAVPVTYLTDSRPTLYTKDFMQVRYSGKTRVIRHNVTVYSDSKRTKLIKSYWQETI